MKKFLPICVFMLLLFSSCKKNESNETNMPSRIVDKNGFIVPEKGSETEKPETGKATLQGRVLYNSIPVKNIEIKLCEKFDATKMCLGKTLDTKTNVLGEYSFKNIQPKVYEVLFAKVFETNAFVFETSKVTSRPAKYKLEANKTFFAPVIHLYKSDLKIKTPEDGTKIKAKDLKIEWNAYENVDYYKISLVPTNSANKSDAIIEEIKGESFKVAENTKSGEYTLDLEAFNSKNVRLAKTPLSIYVTILE